MAGSLISSPATRTLADLLNRLGGIAPERVRYYPAPGTATVADAVEIEAKESRLCELVDGVLVEKEMGFKEASLAGAILACLRAWIVPRKLGKVVGADGMMQLIPDLVRIPDVSYISRERMPAGKVPDEAAPLLVPDLAVEVLSPSNTVAEMRRKRNEYFDAGVRIVWIVDPAARTVAVYTTAENHQIFKESDTLDGGAVLFGFTMELAPLFAELDD